MSALGDASTARQEPSLISITNRKPFSISTTVWLTLPPPKYLAAPWVRLDRPDATAASWSAVVRSRSSETATGSPSAETTIVWMTPGTFRTKFVTSQFRFSASLLSSAISTPRGAGRVGAPGPGHAGVSRRLRSFVVIGDGRLLASALEALLVAGQPLPDVVGRAGGDGLVGLTAPAWRRAGQARRQARAGNPQRWAGRADGRLVARWSVPGSWRRDRRWHRDLDAVRWWSGAEPVGAGRLEDGQPDLFGAAASRPGGRRARGRRRGRGHRRGRDHRGARRRGHAAGHRRGEQGVTVGHHDQRVGQQDQRGHALVPGVAQLDLDAVAGGQAGDHEQAEALRQGRVDTGRVDQALVDLHQLGVGHADAAVLDLDHVAGGDRLAGHVHHRLGRRERGRVLDQLGQDVGHVAGRLADDGQLVEAHELHPAVVLHLREGGLQDLGERDRLAPAARRCRAGEHDQVLGVAPHAGRQAVEAQELLARRLVALPSLQVLDQLELAVDQDLVAPGEVEEHVADALAQGRLLGGDLDGDVVHLAEGRRHLADLVAGDDRGGDLLGLEVDLLGPLQLLEALHHRRQPALDQLLGGLLEALERLDHRLRHRQRDADRDEQHQHDQAAAGDRRGVGGLVRGVDAAQQAEGLLLLDRAQPVDLGVAGGQPLLRVDAQVEPVGQSQGGLAKLRRALDAEAGHRACVEAALLGGGERLELPQPGVARRDRRGELVAVLAGGQAGRRLRRDRLVDQQGVQQAALVGDVLLAAREAHHVVHVLDQLQADVAEGRLALGELEGHLLLEVEQL